MATKPMFSPSQDMRDVSPEDVAEAKRRALMEAAYNKAATTPAAPASAPKKMAKGGKVSSASKRADGCATKGKTKGKFV